MPLGADQNTKADPWTQGEDCTDGSGRHSSRYRPWREGDGVLPENPRHLRWQRLLPFEVQAAAQWPRRPLTPTTVLLAPDEVREVVPYGLPALI